MLVLAFSLFQNVRLIGQERLSITAGFGFPEYLNLGAQYELDDFQVGLSIGELNGFEVLTVSTNVFYHFAGYSDLSYRRPWFGKIGLTYMDGHFFFDRYNDDLVLNVRVGGEINYSAKVGMVIDGGLFHRLKQENKITNAWGPSFGILWFYKI